MKAAQINEYGDPSAIHLNNVSEPAINDDQVLVEVHASSINPFDSKLRSGAMKQMIPLTFPATLGGDIAGVVTQIGSNVTSVAVGDKIFGQANVVAGNSGAFAEYAATSAGQIAKAPSSIDLTTAASLPLVGVSALQALTDHTKLQAGQKILITGGAGGIGSIAVQIAKHIGATVVATATGDDIELVKKLGADEVVDYASEDLAQFVRDFDAVFNTVSPELFDQVLHILKPGGIGVSMTGGASEGLAEQLEITVVAQMTKVTTDALDHLRELVESEVVTPQIAKVFPLDQIVEAFGAKETGHLPGKIVIAIK